MAEVVLRDELARAGLAAAVSVDSAGTGDWHLGEPMHGPAEEELARRGYDGSAHRARQIQPSWLVQHDLLVAMDRKNPASLRRMAPDAQRARVRLLRSFDPALAGDDPWDRRGPRPLRRAAGVLRARARPGAGRCAGARQPACRTARPARAAPDVTGAAERIERLTGQAVRELRAAGSQHRWAHYRAVLADGRAAFAKVASAGLDGVFEAEARGLRWLGEAGAVGVPEVLGGDEATLVVSWVAAGRAEAAAAERFGRDLARMHRAGAPSFGAPWPGFIASLFLPNDALAAPAAPADRDPWPDWYTARRVLPYLRLAVDAGMLNSADAGLIESAAARAADLAGPAEPPSRIHGDLWAGNVIWSGGSGWLVDRRARRAPGDRPGHARLVRGAVPGPDPGFLRAGVAAGPGMAAARPAAPTAPVAGARVPVRGCLPVRGAGRRPRRASCVIIALPARG
jgi:fructosamine-3-kinase/protein-tyrosine-phosphatase